MYSYKALWVRVVDGDTVILNVDLGFNTFHKGAFRLLNVNAPELKGGNHVLGEAAKEFLEAKLLQAGDLRVETQKPDKYGRWLAKIFYKNDQGVEFCVNDDVNSFLLTESSK